MSVLWMLMLSRQNRVINPLFVLFESKSDLQNAQQQSQFCLQAFQQDCKFSRVFCGVLELKDGEQNTK